MAPNKNKTAYKTTHSSKSKPACKCRLCGRYHPLRVCWEFLDMNCAQRRAAMKKHGYCSNCLAHKHSEPTCLSGAKCNYCQKEHHTVLHSPADSDIESSKGNFSCVRNSNPGQRSRGQIADKMTNQSQVPKPTLSSMQTVALRIIQAKKIQTARALLDQCAPVSRIKWALVK